MEAAPAEPPAEEQAAPPAMPGHVEFQEMVRNLTEVRPDPPAEPPAEDRKPHTDTKSGKAPLDGKMLGKYVILTKLASGGMGDVWTAVDPFAGLEIKLLHDSKRDPMLAGLAKVAGILPGDSDDVRRNKIQEYMVTRRFEFEKLSEEQRKALVREQHEYARDPRVPRVVIKTLAPKFSDDEDIVERFKREIKICSQLDHPNIVKILGSGQHNGMHYAVLEYVPAIDLDEAKLTPEQATLVISKTLDALIHAHEKKVLHRDIKPDNILVTKDFKTVKLTDFGLAKVVDATLIIDKLTKSNVIMGTPFYVSYEAACSAPIVEKSDVNSLGATFYKLLTGQPPATGTNAREVVLNVQSIDDPPWIRELAPHVSQDVEDAAMLMETKDINMRTSTYEARDLISTIIKEKRYVHREPTRDQAENRSHEIKQLTREISKLSKTVKKATRIGQAPVELYELAQKFERLGMLHDPKDGVYCKMHAKKDDEGAKSEEKEHRSARLDALEHAVTYYEDFFRNKKPGELSEEQILAQQYSKPLAEKRAGLEKRRLKRLNELGQLQVQAPRRHKRTLGIAAGVLAGVLAVAGGIGYGLNEKARKDRISERIVAAEQAFQSKDYSTAMAKLSEAKQDAVNYLESHDFNQRIIGLRSRVENADLHDRVSVVYSNARELAFNKKDFAGARKECDESVSIEAKLTDETLKAKLNHARLELAESSYAMVRTLIEEHKYSEASAGIGFVNRLLDQTNNELKEKAGALRAKLKEDEGKIIIYLGEIKMYEGLMELFNKVAADYTKLDEQVKAGKFPKRTELDQLDGTLDQISTKLIKIEPESIGKAEFDKKVSAVKETKDKVGTLVKDLDARQIAHLSKLAKELGDYVNSVEDYTKEGVSGKVNAAKGALEVAKGMYANMDQNADDFKAVQQKLTIIDAKLQDLDRKVIEYDVFIKVSKDGTADEKLTALASLVKIYIGVGRLVEAEKSLNDIADKSGLGVYTKIIELEKKVSEASQYVKRTPLGLDSSVIDSYSAVVEAYKADVSKADTVLASLALLSERSKLDAKGAEVELRAVKSLFSRVTELKELIKNDPKPEYDLELKDKEKSLSDKSSASYNALSQFSATARAVLDAAGKPMPQLDFVKQLNEAYKSAGYQKKADAVLERFK